MKSQEGATLCMAIKTYYPRENLFPNQQSIELWYRQLSDIDYQVASAALNKWVATNRWSPTIADIREMSSGIVSGEEGDWGSGWQEATKAIRYYGYMREEEAIASMSDITREVVKDLGYQKLCMSESEDADRANFRMLYERKAKKAKEDRVLPDKLKGIIESLGQFTPHELVEAKEAPQIETKAVSSDFLGDKPIDWRKILEEYHQQ